MKRSAFFERRTRHYRTIFPTSCHQPWKWSCQKIQHDSKHSPDACSPWQGHPCQTGPFLPVPTYDWDQSGEPWYLACQPEWNQNNSQRIVPCLFTKSWIPVTPDWLNSIICIESHNKSFSSCNIAYKNVLLMKNCVQIHALNCIPSTNSWAKSCPLSLIWRLVSLPRQRFAASHFCKSEDSVHDSAPVLCLTLCLILNCSCVEFLRLRPYDLKLHPKWFELSFEFLLFWSKNFPRQVQAGTILHLCWA